MESGCEGGCCNKYKSSRNNTACISCSNYTYHKYDISAIDCKSHYKCPSYGFLIVLSVSRSHSSVTIRLKQRVYPYWGEQPHCWEQCIDRLSRASRCGHWPLPYDSQSLINMSAGGGRGPLVCCPMGTMNFVFDIISISSSLYGM